MLAELVADPATSTAVIVGFAAETGDGNGGVLGLARAKLARKGCDLLVVNDVSGGQVFGAEDNEAVILGADGSAIDVPWASKSALAHGSSTRCTAASRRSTHLPHLLRESPMHPEMRVHHLRRLISLTPHAGGHLPGRGTGRVARHRR